MRSERGQTIGGVAFLAMILVVGLVLLLSVSMVKFGTVKAVTFAGGLTGTVFSEGLNWKAPWQGTRKVSVLVNTYESGAHPESSNADYTDFQVSAQTSDGQQIKISYTVKFKLLPGNVTSVLRTVGDMDQVVENVVKADSRSWARKLAQNYEAGALYTGEGILSYEAAVRSTLERSFGTLNVTLVDLLVRKIDFDQDYVNAIENKQIAEENIKTQRFNAQAAEHERDRLIRLAEAEKQAIILNAEAQAEQITLLANAQAKAITLQGIALREYPEMIQWEFVGHLDQVKWGFLPSEGIAPLLPVQEMMGP